MAEKGPPAPAPKPLRIKIPVPKLTTSKTNIPLEPKIIIRLIDYPKGQNALYPPSQPAHLPDIPAAPHNLPSNPPNPLNPPNPPDPPNPRDSMYLPNPPQPHQLNWSYFKPAFSGKTEEDATVHLLKTNDWTETHNFPDDTKVRRFCLTLTGEARLWYESLRPIEMHWNVLQECFRQQYSKFGSLREQYFHMWRSFHYDENTDTIDSYILKIKQVALLLNYGEPEILELFKKHFA